MKKLLQSLFLLMLFAVTAMAQDRTVTGTVTAREDGLPLPGVSVKVKGSAVGTSTGVDGTFRLNVAPGKNTLVFSFIGYTTQEVAIPQSGSLSVALVSDAKQLSEVVVTGLGISRQQKAVTNSVQQVSADKLQISRETSIGNALTGKVSGVQLVGSPSAGFRAANIRIRGVNSLSGSNPLYILDGTPVEAEAINMDNVESISILKGASATAIYGQRGSSGVVVVTSKSGKKGGTSVEFNSQTVFENVSLLPEYQNEYAGGYEQEWEIVNGQKVLNYGADESWGPKMDGTMYRPYYSWIPGHPMFGKEVPLVPQPDNVKNFFETANTYNNNLGFSGGKEGFNFRINYNNISRDLVVPNSKQMKNIVNAKASYDINSKLSVSTNINYMNTDQQGNISEGYGGGLTGSFNQWFQRQIDIKELRNYKNADGTFNSWNILSPTNPRPAYWNNPYFDVYESVPTFDQDRVFGDISLAYAFTPKLKVQGWIRNDIRNNSNTSRNAEGGLDIPSFSAFSSKYTERNYEILGSYDTSFGNFTFDVNVGGNIRKNGYEYQNQATVGGLAIPGLYAVSNSKDRPTAVNYIERKEVRSIYSRGSLGYRGFAYVDFSARNDWSSALPADNNSYFYPSVGGSLVLSELGFLNQNKTLSFLKLRGSFAQVGSDIDPYRINTTYDSGTFYGSSASLYLPNTLQNAALKPALQSEIEGGIEAKFLNDRLGFDVTAYKRDNRDQILSLTVPSTSGYSTAIVNAGNIQGKGVEVQLYGTPVTGKDFKWDVTFNWARNRSVVKSLAEGLDNRLIGGAGVEAGPFWNGIAVEARVGQEWGTVLGRKFRRDANGNKIVNANGTYAYDINQNLGTILPEWTGGFVNQMSYKNVFLNFAIDVQQGGQFYSTSQMFNAYSGLGIETVGLNDKGNPKRDPVAAGGGIRADGVFANGQPNNVYLEAVSYYGNLFGLHEAWMFDASYAKLREVSLGYNLDSKALSKTPFKNASVSLTARNVALLYSSVKGIDPSELERFWYEGGQLPQTRAIGFNVRLGF